MSTKQKRRCAMVDQSACVACGCCVKVCPKAAISIFKGVYAWVDDSLCIGCGKCQKVCPASVITVEVKEREEALV